VAGNSSHRQVLNLLSGYCVSALGYQSPVAFEEVLTTVRLVA
jgi:hypothetical protein